MTSGPPAARILPPCPAPHESKEENVFFDGWSGLLRVVAIGVPAYFALLLLIRISGKRTLSKLNAFDLVITVAFGSTLATALLDDSLVLAEIITAFALLVLLQLLITWTSVRIPRVERFVKAEATLLYADGNFQYETMMRERVTSTEISAAVREQGYADVAEVHSVYLETDGSLSVVTESAA